MMRKHQTMIMGLTRTQIICSPWWWQFLFQDVVAAAPILYLLASLCKPKSCKDRWRKNKSKPFKQDLRCIQKPLRTAGQLITISKTKPKAFLFFQVIVVEVALGRDRRETITLEEHLSCSCQCKVKVRDNFKVLFITRTMLCTAIFFKRKASFVLSMKKCP